MRTLVHAVDHLTCLAILFVRSFLSRMHGTRQNVSLFRSFSTLTVVGWFAFRNPGRKAALDSSVEGSVRFA